jgi:hypothetical protein
MLISARLICGEKFRKSEGRHNVLPLPKKSEFVVCPRQCNYSKVTKRAEAEAKAAQAKHEMIFNLMMKRKEL